MARLGKTRRRKYRKLMNAEKRQKKRRDERAAFKDQDDYES